jgi:photosystem II stability/assembly factor-like uncharacterized protein
MKNLTLLIPTRALLFLIVCFIGCNAGEDRTHNDEVKSEQKPAVNMRQADSGIEWRNKSQISSAAFSGPNTAWLVTTREGGLLRTTDGGNSWNRISASIVGGFEVVNFIDEQSGWAFSKQANVWQTHDGGNTWEKLASIRDSNGGGTYLSSGDLIFTSAYRGWVIETLSVWRTEDGGHSWNEGLSASDQGVNKRITSIFFINAQVGWACGRGGLFYETTDGGSSWHARMINESADFDEVFFLDENTGWVKDGSNIYRTVDGGKTWHLRAISKDNTIISSAAFLTEDEWWAAGYIQQGGDAAPKSGRGLVLHTADGGKTWKPVTISENNPFFSKISFLDEHHGWLISRDNVYRTNDGGKTWNAVLRLNS